MKALSIETATMLGGLALMGDKEGLIAEVRLNVRTTHSERLMAELDHLLKQAGMAIGDVDLVAVSSGPGSFTGLRIGLSTAKGLSFSTGIPVVAVPTLEAFAWAMPGVPLLCPMFDARKKEVYAGVFEWDGEGFIRIMPETSIKPGELAHHIPGKGPILFAGQGAELYRETLLDVFGKRAHFAPPHLMAPSPASVAHVGLKMAHRGEFSDPVRVGPYYIRKSEAELKK